MDTNKLFVRKRGRPVDKREIVLYGVGDMAVPEPEPDARFKNFAPLFKEENAVVFGQLEAVLFEKNGSPAAQCRMPCSADPTMAAALGRAGFDVISFGTNHALDWGREAFLETIDRLEAEGMEVIGCGRNEEDARRIKIIERFGTKIAFLGYNSILPQDYWAFENRPGCNPARGVTAYVPVEHDQPGTPCRMFTFPHPDDLKNMTEDIAKAKSMADIVIVSIHWGIHFKRAVLADYQRYYAHFAIDAGADLILGHHAHILKPIEVYKGKAIFYSLGNFVTGDGPNPRDVATLGVKDHTQTKGHKEMAAISTEENVPGRAMPIGSYQHTMCRCVIRDGKIESVSYIPTFLPEDMVPMAPAPGSEEYEAIVKTINEINSEENIKASFTEKDGEIFIS